MERLPDGTQRYAKEILKDSLGRQWICYLDLKDRIWVCHLENKPRELSGKTGLKARITPLTAVLRDGGGEARWDREKAIRFLSKLTENVFKGN